MKTLMLAAVAALTLGLGAAYAAQPSQQNDSGFWQPHVYVNTTTSPAGG